MSHSICLIGAPVQTGASQPGCLTELDALRMAGIVSVLEKLGSAVTDAGNVALSDGPSASHPNPSTRHLPETVGWTKAIFEASVAATLNGHFPVFLGGDHSISMGSVPAVPRHAAQTGRPQFVLWLDAHPDFHTLESTESGNLHGIPVAYITGQGGFDRAFPPVDPKHVCMLGIRSVDGSEQQGLRRAGVSVHDMWAIDEHGFARLLRTFLEQIEAANGVLHVSLDVDFLDLDIAPAVGTTVPSGDVPRGASGHGDAVRQRPRHLARCG